MRNFVLKIALLAFLLPLEAYSENSQIPSLDTPAPPKMPEPPKLDIGNKAKKAADMAIFGAVMAQSQCAMLMSQAMQAEAGSQERTLLMAMAAQQCAQAAQSQEAGEKNEKNSKKTKPEPAKMPGVPKFAKIKMPGAPDEKFNLSNSEQSKALPSEGNTARAVIATESGEASELITPEEAKEEAPGIEAPPEDKSVLSPIPAKKITFDAAEKKSAPFYSANLGALGGISPSQSRGDGTDFSNRAIEADGHDHDHPKKKKSDSKLAPSTSSSSYKRNVSNLINDFFGTNDRGFSSGIIELSSEAKKVNQPRINIFQYASIRYRKAAYKDKKVSVGVRVKK